MAEEAEAEVPAALRPNPEASSGDSEAIKGEIQTAQAVRGELEPVLVARNGSKMAESELGSLADEDASRNHRCVEEKGEIAGNQVENGGEKESWKEGHDEMPRVEANECENHGEIREGSEAKSVIPEWSDSDVFSGVGCGEAGLCRKRYSRSEMEALGLDQGDAQQRRWSEIYGSLAPIVSRELDQIFESKKRKQGNRKVDQHQRLGRKDSAASTSSSSSEPRTDSLSSANDAAPISGKFLQNVNDNLEEMNMFDYASGEFVVGDDDGSMIEDTSQDDEDSDNEYAIQRPAFFVEGEPDFESGPPQDGLEYLRRVRWEAAQIPKVKVARLRERQLHKEQTPYMPHIPDIARCPQHLLPSKQWEDAFLGDFSQLRQALSQLERSSSVKPNHPLSTISGSEDSKEATRNWPKLTSPPMLSVVLQMEPVSRVSMLRNRISSLETASTLSRENCLWLYALCAAVDTPFDADTSASLRCLLRKCSSLLTRKEELDDEVVMLNMLVTIAGRCFGQAGD